ncbi:ankyrin [Dothidotthia symphoricarpi CBS 119687]|uniref:Ankyrin n=1 Tax=Dothidotthia symphoricarpi CBS 119687 TaxID=1392245 RepID=A0A6A5ZYN1_9PLEO|nr:ankyrin [Dothidotthia symphoricarpi CBS 119687]KAF2124125.1 ankyrin [Dothidotthia symphoricarpi CBS 119687]
MSSVIIPKNCLRLGCGFAVLNNNSPDDPSQQLSLRTLRAFAPRFEVNHGNDLESELAQYGPIHQVPAFASWLEQRDRDFTSQPQQSRLWITGSPNTDRVAFVSVALQTLRRRTSRNEVKTQVLYFLCNRQDVACNNAAAILKGWMYQLLVQRPDICQELCKWFEDPDNRHFHLDNVGMLWHEFRHALVDGDAGTTYCIISDLHECDEKSVQVITKLLSEPFTSEHCLGNDVRIKVLITSRVIPLSDQFEKLDLDVLTASNAGFNLTFSNSPTPGKLFQSINSDVRSYCLVGLEILAALKSRPTIETLRNLIGLSDSDDAFNEILDHCRLLIEIQDDRVQFVSSTVRDFFAYPKNASSIHASLAQDCLKILKQELCDQDIANLDRMSRQCDYDINTLQYAVLHWADHIRLAPDNTIDLLPDILDVFAQSQGLAQKWWTVHLRMFHHISQIDVVRFHTNTAIHPTTVLHALARFNLHRVLYEVRNSSHWVGLQYCMRSTDSFGMDPLAVALSMHHTKSAKFFIQQGVTINAMHVRFAADSSVELAGIVFEDFLQRCPSTLLSENDVDLILHKVVTTGDEARVAQAIEFLKTNNPSRFPWTRVNSLGRAFSCGHDHVVKMLLDITDLDSDDAIPEIIAHTVDGHEDAITKHLLKLPRFASFVTSDKLIDSLTLAIRLKCFTIVNLLVNAANMNRKDRWGWTPLEVGAMYGNPHAIYRLLLLGCGVQGTSREAGVALHLLIHEAGVSVGMPVLEELLLRGARMQYVHFGITALHVAAEQGRAEIMAMVLESMSDAEIEEDIDRLPSSLHGEWRDKTALAIAAVKGYGEIIRLLLEAGADEAITDKDGKTALELASEAGWVDVVEVFEHVHTRREKQKEKKRKKKQDRKKRGKK